MAFGHGPRCETVVDYRKRKGRAMTFNIEIDREVDGRWIAEVPDLAGVMTYGATREEAVAHVQALALRVIADRLEHNEAPADLLTVTFRAA
jgi:predicted RNase H-like HicB family nuclease